MLRGWGGVGEGPAPLLYGVSQQISNPTIFVVLQFRRFTSPAITWTCSLYLPGPFQFNDRNNPPLAARNTGAFMSPAVTDASTSPQSLALPTDTITSPALASISLSPVIPDTRRSPA